MTARVGSGRKTGAVFLGLLAFQFAGFGAARLGAEDSVAFSYFGDLSQELLLKSADWRTDTVLSDSWALQLNGNARLRGEKEEFFLSHRTEFKNNALTTTLYEAYALLMPSDGLDIFLGKKRQTIGGIASFVPGDSYNPLTGFFDQKSGPLSVLVNVSPGAEFGLSFGTSFEEMVSASTAELNKVIFSIQSSLVLGDLQAGLGLVWRPEGSFNPGASLSYNLDGLIFGAEGAVEFLPQSLYPTDGTWKKYEPWSQALPSFTGGARYTIYGDDSDVTLSAEYLYWGQGLDSASYDAWAGHRAALVAGGSASASALAQFLAASPKPFKMRHYGIFKVQANLGEALSLGNILYLSLEKTSILGNHSVTFKPWNALDLVLGFTWAAGEAGSEWERIPSSSSPLFSYQISIMTRYNF